MLFEALEIGATDAWSLFLSLDHNEDYQNLGDLYGFPDGYGSGYFDGVLPGSLSSSWMVEHGHQFAL